MKVTHILPILFQGFYANSQCSEAVTGVQEILKEFSQALESRGFCTQQDVAELEYLIGDNEDYSFSEESRDLCDFYPDKFIEFERTLQNGWDFIKSFDILDMEEFKNYLLEVNKAVATFSRFGHGKLYVDPEIREAFGILFGDNADIQTRVETVYYGFKNWQTAHSDYESAEMLQKLLLAIIDELKPVAKSLGDLVEAVDQILRNYMSRQRRSIMANQATAYKNYMEELFTQDKLEFIGDLTDKQRLEKFTLELNARMLQSNERFADISEHTATAITDVVDFWNSKYPKVMTYVENFQLENVLDEVQLVIASSQFKNLLIEVLGFPRAIWEEFDIDEFIQMNRFIWAEIYQDFNGLIDDLAGNTQTSMIDTYSL